MKKLLVIIMAVLVLCGCSRRIEYVQPTGSLVDVSDYGLEKGNFYAISFAEMLEKTRNGESFITVVAHLGCLWCDELMPVLDEICTAEGMKIYYANSYGEENLTDKDSIDGLTDMLKEYYQRNGKEFENFYVPTIFYIREGRLHGIHMGTVNTHDPYVAPMTENEIARLKYQLQKEFEGFLEG